MKIMLVNTYYYPEIIGGAEYSVKKLAEQLVKKGHRILVLCTGNEASNEEIDGVEVHRIRVNNICRSIEIDKKNYVTKMVRRFQDIWNCKNERLIAREIEAFNPDIIHTNGLYDITPIIWKVSNDKGIKVVHTIRDYYLRCPRVSFECSYSSKKCGLFKFFCNYHFKRNLASSKYVDYVTAPSSRTLTTMVNLGFFPNAQKSVISNAVEISEKELQNIKSNKLFYSKNDGKTRFLYLGTLTEKKGILWLLDTFIGLSDDKIELNIAGKGELQNVIQKAVEHDKRIRFHGFLNEEGVKELLFHNDVLICPSLWNEPFGRVVIDAYKYGLPVIASNMGALPEIVEDNVTGLVIPAGDCEKLRSSILKYKEDRELLVQHADNAFVKVKEYSLDNQAELFINKTYLNKS